MKPNELKIAMARLNLSAKDLAEAAGYTAGHVSHLRGGRSPITKLLEAFLLKSIECVELSEKLSEHEGGKWQG